MFSRRQTPSTSPTPRSEADACSILSSDRTSGEGGRRVSDLECQPPYNLPANSPVSPRVLSLKEDMDVLTLSRKDNPYILNKLEVNGNGTSVAEGHLHDFLVRSPPPQFPTKFSSFVFPEPGSPLHSLSLDGR